MEGRKHPVGWSNVEAAQKVHREGVSLEQATREMIGASIDSAPFLPTCDLTDFLTCFRELIAMDDTAVVGRGGTESI